MNGTGRNPCLNSSIQQVNSALLHRLSQLILNQPEARLQKVPPLTWLFVDELRRAGRLANLPELLVEGRSKGLSGIFAFQDLPGLCEVYGPNLAKELFGTPRNKAFLKLSDPETAEYASRHFGQLELEIDRHSRSWSTSYSQGQQSSWSYQWGSSTQRTNHTRPAIGMREFMKVPEANFENGISGYYDTATIGDPYFATLSGDFFETCLSRPHPGVPNVLSRPRDHQILREWERADLERLGLNQFPELLLPPPGKIKPISSGKQQKPRPSDEDGGESGGMLALLPKRDL